MNTYFIIGVLSIWVLHQLLIKLLGRKRIGYTIIAPFLFILGFCYFYFYDSVESTYYEYYYYGTITAFLLYLLIVNLYKALNKSVSEYDFYELEKELEELSSNSELLRQRFISTIEILNDGIFFRDFDDTCFGSDKYINVIGLNDNNFTLNDLEKLMHKDDLYQYKTVLDKTTKKNPVYKIDYRVKKGDSYLWIKEVGKKIIINKKTTFISIIKPMDMRQFPETEVDVLNALKNQKKLYEEMQKLLREKVAYQLVIIHLSNIPQINEKYGRDIGDLMMGEYVTKLRYNFIKDNQSLYRIGGIDFALIIKDDKKYEILKRALTGDGDLLNLSMVFGGITQTLYPNLGISESPYLGKSPDILLNEAKKALEISLKDSSNKNYCFFDEV